MASEQAESGDSDRIINRIEEGDEIRVSERATPMEVQDVRESEFERAKLELVAENHHGRYLIREQSDGSLTFKVSDSNYWGSTWSKEATDVEVTHDVE